MTIIAYKDGIMCADTQSVKDGRRYKSGPKIFRRSDGALCGSCGNTSSCEAFCRWFEAGMPRDDKPKVDDSFLALMVYPSGEIWLCYDDVQPFLTPERDFETIGEPTACDFAEGVMYSGLSAERAVRLAIEHCVFVGGEVQVERL